MEVNSTFFITLHEENSSEKGGSPLPHNPILARVTICDFG